MKTLAPEQLYGHEHWWCCFEPGQTSTKSPSSGAGSHARHTSERALKCSLASQPETAPKSSCELEAISSNGAEEERLDSQKHEKRRSREGKTDHFSVNELFSLLKTAYELDIYGALHGQSTTRWEQVREAQETNGYKRSTKGLRTKLEELLHDHMVCILIAQCFDT